MAKTVFGAVAIAALVLSGCAVPRVQPPSESQYGPMPESRLWQPLVKRYFDDYLKDPDSARYRVGCPVRGYLVHPNGFKPKLIFVGWLVRVDVNAKNGYGGYTGFKPYIATAGSGPEPSIVLEGDFDSFVAFAAESPPCVVPSLQTTLAG